MIKIIKASAGSGKTYQLTYEYIKLLLGQKKEDGSYFLPKRRKEYHQHILAVTFTNMATKEMKSRIVRELSILAGKVEGVESPYIKSLCEELHAESKPIMEAAGQALVELLFDYSNFNVSTIDSFFQVILRTFAKEAEITYNYDIELNDKYAVRMGVNRFLSDVSNGVFKDGKKKNKFDAERWIAEYISNEVAEGHSWNIFKDVEKISDTKQYNGSGSLCSFAEIVNTEQFKASADDVKEYFSDEGVKILEFKRVMGTKQKIELEAGINAIRQLFALFESEGMNLEFLSRNGGILWAKKIFDTNELDKGVDPNLFKEKAEKNPDKWFTSKSPRKLSDSALSHGMDLVRDFSQHAQRYLIYQDVNRKLYLFALLGEISKYIFKFREENNLILLSDTNDLLHKIINDEDTPFIYERVGVWLNHFLIDEFQDTSRSQWLNMRPLLNNSVSDGNDNLIIGDEKQCIYRFRNSDPSLLRTEVETSFPASRSDNSKSTNWRSKANIIKFNNTFFTVAARNLGVEEIYSNVIQQIPEKKLKANAQGFVKKIEVPKPEDYEGTGAGWFKEESFKMLPEIIQGMRHRGYKLKDIALLFNRNDEAAQAIQSILSYNQTVGIQEQLHVVSTESLMLSNSPSVRLIVSTLRYLNTQDLTASEGAEKDATVYLKKEEYLHRILKQYEAQLNAGVEAGDAISKSFEIVDRESSEDSFVSSIIPSELEAFNLVTIAECIIRSLLSKDAIDAENAFIQEFMDIVNDFSNRGGGTIYAFLKWWDQGGCRASIKSPQGQDAINVLTIHKSKGLEFKCVILPVCDWTLSGKLETYWVKRKEAQTSTLFNDVDPQIIPPMIPIMPNSKMGLEETDLGYLISENEKAQVIDNLNKTYVAFTRAEDELYMMVPQDGAEGKDVKINNLLDYFVAEAQPSLIEELEQYGDVATMAVGCEDGFCIGDKFEREEEKEEYINGERVEMPSYKVKFRPGLVKFDVPDLFVSEQREKGILMHKILSKIRFKEDSEFALHLYRKRASLLPEEFEDMRNSIMEALEDDRVKGWFAHDNHVYNERSIVSKKEKLRPDRFFTTHDGRTIVVDYKFGERHLHSYKKQVNCYMHILKECGYENIEGYVWYPIEKIIEPVSL